VGNLQQSGSPQTTVLNRGMGGIADTPGGGKSVDSGASAYSSEDDLDKSSDDGEEEKHANLMLKKKVKGERVKKEKYQNRYERRARGLIKDFEIAVRDDPHAWSAGPATAEDFSFGSGLGLFALHCLFR
jgi:hypothetical protein